MSIAELSNPEMELGFLDLGGASLFNESQVNDASPKPRTAETSDSPSSIVRTKSKSPKGSPPFANVLTRLTSQIKKPPRRKTSPIRWSPRKKVDSYLNRKIKLLQEAGGMNDTLDEALGHSNPHYCLVEREKIAAKEAATKVMDARKAAMVEASWCRILKAARIPTKEAEALLLKAEKEVTEAVEAAMANGVIMYDTPDRPWKHFEIGTSSVRGKGSTTHTVKASFETAFEVDRQVASAVKTAFIRLAHCSSFNRDEFKDLLRRISENPDNQELSESDTGSELEIEHEDDSCTSQRKIKKLSPQKFNGAMLIDMMVERLKCLKEDELASLATIVATCGLNAALASTGDHSKAQDHSVNGATMKQKQAEPELPSLDKFLVKKMTKLEREVQEARNASKAKSNEGSEGNNDNSADDKPVSADDVPSLEKFLVKKLTRLEKEVQEARNARKAEPNKGTEGNNSSSHPCHKSWKQDTEVPSLDKFLVKHVSRLEREVQEAKNQRRGGQMEKENVDSNGSQDGNGEHRENEKMPVRSQETESGNWAYGKQHGKTNCECGSLDEVLVKHVSRLEKEKMRFGKERLELKKKDAIPKLDTNVGGGGGLDQILVKHKSRLEREKTNATQRKPDDGVTNSMAARRQARERELLEMWGDVGLGSMRPHVSRLERDKASGPSAAWRKAEEEERTAVLQE
ncbi:hypothetical protein Cgig2_016739 [Carnegiea gigantea]|uniref:Uncharacterized protein n=1 Tax=Carnegiea gigantea TaxID=171969 RepID=A0A9Q1QR19_9CARY|nr:hypothetical protein Cgig2_016739 [Carnegiea gigantea]